MKSFITAATLLAATASADLCAQGSADVNDNWYCQKVNAITYTGVGGQGSYNKITNMDPSSGACSSTPFGYSGSLSPLDADLSVHFRGPLTLKQFVVYMPGNASLPSGSAPSHKVRRDVHGHGHKHARMHKQRHAEVEERDLGDTVTALINGKWQTWANQYAGGAAPAAAIQAPNPVPAPVAPVYQAASSAAAGAANRLSGGSSSSKPGSSSSKPGSSSNKPGSSPNKPGSSSSSSLPSTDGSTWTRQAYYNAEAGTAEGLVFLNHEGGSGSGVFDYHFGNSLSYASADGASGASSPQILEDCTLASSTEIVIMSDKKCTDDTCGYVRPGTVAYQGFAGDAKAFMFEFGMPDDGKTGASIYDAVNMPAIWTLSGQIPRTLQYGKTECSCWTSGCGEFDIFEVLAAGDTRCKSTLHGNIAGGDSDYFERPTSGTIKAALLLYNDNIHIKVLDPSTEFGPDMGQTFLEEMVKDTMEDSLEKLVSLFKLSG